MIGQLERQTQNRIVRLFQSVLKYEYLGNWEERSSNSNIEEEYLKKYLTKKGYNTVLINRAIEKLKDTANNPQESLYNNNKNTYNLLRYGIKVKENVEDTYTTIHLIDWKNPEANHFAIAEEVTIRGNREKRPDIVLYINGIAVGVLELKRSTVSIGDGIRQNITNQQKEFIGSFFGTIQFVFAGNDSEGLRYGTIGTEEKYFLQWKEDEADDSTYQLDKYLTKICNKQRFIELLYDFILFDGGVKKLPRPHQYFGVKAAQKSIEKREGGIIWHTQGSGKSIVMVLLAKWILENNPNARVAIITDRDELDKQIKRVFEDVGEEIYRTSSGKDLMLQLEQAKPRLLCSLVHKFGQREVENFDAFIRELKNNPPNTAGDLHIFVDECHRTQSGKLNTVMKTMLPNALFIGFTGTPLLKEDKQTTSDIFGKYIHTYKFNEAVKDSVVLDLMYEARNIEQRISSQKHIDTWFDTKTSGLNDFQKFELRKRWGTMQEVLSSKNRMHQIVMDIVLDFSSKPRLNDNQGNAILVASSIHEACRYYELFQSTPLKNKCALITSYNPSHRDVVHEDTGANTETAKQEIYKIYSKILENVEEGGKTKAETYEDKAKMLFVKEPANMKLLIVVAKLLTGFDAPSCTYIYLDKDMQDHTLFQAICRVNRLDGETKDFGYIVDYKELFKKVENAVSVYTSELDYTNFSKEETDIMLKDRLTKAKERLNGALEELKLMCEHVPSPQSDLDYMRYFGGNIEIEGELKATESKRFTLYKHIVALIRAYANIKGEMIEAGYSSEEIESISNDVNNYLRLRELIKNYTGETLDVKSYEADMRFLIDNYIQADPSERIDDFDNQSLLELIINTGISEAIKKLPEGIKKNQKAVAETMANSVAQRIIKEHLIDPTYFEEMSKLLKTIISELKQKKISYEEYLKEMAELAKKVVNAGQDEMPSNIQTSAQRALYNNLGKNADLAIKVDEAVKRSKQADFRGNVPKENLIKREIFAILQDKNEVERIFAIIKEQKDY